MGADLSVRLADQPLATATAPGAAGDEAPAPLVLDGPLASSRSSRNDLVRRVLLRFLAVAVLTAMWWFVAWRKVWDPTLVPSPQAVWHALILSSTGDGYSGGTLAHHLLVSLRRILIGSGLAVLIGVPVGLLIGGIAPIRIILEPFVTFLRTLPPLAYFSLLILWFGIDEAPKVWLLFIAAVAPIAATTAAAVHGVAPGLLEAGRTLGASRLRLVRDVTLPAALPEILTGIRVAVAVAYTSLVAAETVNGTPGIGGMIRDAQRYLRSDVVVLGILVLGISGLLLDAALRLLERRLAPWRGLV
ncbi:MAG: alkanesulfonates transport system permease protein [Frankiales bacterium]|nr:alkanesulfonates transport system permease protein [Frankiales bacterium]